MLFDLVSSSSPSEFESSDEVVMTPSGSAGSSRDESQGDEEEEEEEDDEDEDELKRSFGGHDARSKALTIRVVRCSERSCSSACCRSPL